MTRVPGRMWSAIVCADWSKERKGREVYVASPAMRRVWRLDPPRGGWDVDAVLRAAENVRGGRTRPPLVGFDAPIGVPQSFLRAVGARTFSAWLRRPRDARGFEPCRSVDEWSLARPFFVVPKGEGSLKAFKARMRSLGVDPLRLVDRLAQAKSVFIAGGDETGRIERVRRPELVRRWVQDYGLQKSNDAKSYLAPRGIPAFVEGLRDARGYSVTGSLAAARRSTVAPSRLATVYVEEPEALAEKLRLAEAEAGANVLLLRPTIRSCSSERGRRTASSSPP